MFFLNPYRYGSGALTSLDQLATQPRAVLSLRKLISTATQCIRVRRSSDNAEQDIGFSGSSMDTSSLSSFVGAGSGFVVTWYDQTGNGEHANQSTAANQPRIVNAGSVQSTVTWDDSNDSMSITSLTMGSQYCGIYMKANLPDSTGGPNIILEMTTNYNNNAQSFVVYTDGTSGGPLNVSSRNSTSGSDFRLQLFPVDPSTTRQHSILMNRATTGTSEIQVWQDGTQLSATVSGTAADQTGNYSSYDCYIGSRAGSSLFSDLSLETLVIYNADSSAIRTSIQTLVA